MSVEQKRNFLINLAYFAAILLLFYVTVKYLIVWLLPFLIGLVVALILRRPIDFMIKKTRVGRKVVAPVLTFVLVAIILGGVFFLIYQTTRELLSFISKLPEWYAASYPSIMEAIESRLDDVLGNLPVEAEQGIRSALGKAAQHLQDELTTLSTTIFAWTAKAAAQTPSFLIGLIITVMACFYMSVNLDEAKRYMKKMIPEKTCAFLLNVWNSFGKMVSGVLRSLFIIMCITFVELMIGFAILGIDYTILLALIITLVDILPVLGVGTVLIPWAVFNLVMGNIQLGIGLALLYVIIAIVRNVIEPRLIGEKIGLHPLITLILMYIGLRAVGLLGMFLFPLFALVLKSMYEHGALKLGTEPDRGTKGDGQGIKK